MIPVAATVAAAGAVFLMNARRVSPPADGLLVVLSIIKLVTFLVQFCWLARAQRKLLAWRVNLELRSGFAVQPIADPLISEQAAAGEPRFAASIPQSPGAWTATVTWLRP